MNAAQFKFLRFGLVIIALALHIVSWEWQVWQTSTPDIILASKDVPFEPKNKANALDHKLAAHLAGRDPSREYLLTGLRATGFLGSPNRVMYSSLLGIVLPLVLVGGAVYLHLGKK